MLHVPGRCRGDDLALESEGGEDVVDGVAQAAAPGDGDVLGRGVALGGEGPVGQRVAGADRRDEAVLADELVAEVGHLRLRGARYQVDLAAPQFGVSEPGSAIRRSRTPGAWRWTAASRAGPHAVASASCQRRVKVRLSVARSSSFSGLRSCLAW